MRNRTHGNGCQDAEYDDLGDDIRYEPTVEPGGCSTAADSPASALLMLAALMCIATRRKLQD